MRMIPYGRQAIDEDDISAVVEVLRGDWITQGPTVEYFEDAIRDFVGAKYAIAFSSGTGALHGAAWAAGLGTGDIVYTSPLTFMASANAARYVGARPGLVDIDEKTLNIDLSLLPSSANAVIPVHYAGLPVDLRGLEGRSSPPVVIEDAAHALGASTPYGPVGNCARSDMTCFSFHPVKPITTGEGGMVTTNNEELAERLRRFRSHGIVRMPERAPWYYEVSEVGFHYRMTDIQAALGIQQLKKLPRFLKERSEIARRYVEALSPLEHFVFQDPPASGFSHANHLFTVRTPIRDAVFDGLKSFGIAPQVHYVPIHHHPVSKDLYPPTPSLPEADKAYNHLISLPIFPGLSEEMQETIVSALESLV